MRQIASAALALLFVALAVWYLAERPDEIARLQTASPGGLALVALCFAANAALYGVFTAVVLRALGVGITSSECLALSFTATMFNLLLPMRLGIGLRAYYLKRVHGFAYSHFVGTMAAFFSLLLLAHASFGLLGMLVVVSSGTRLSFVAFAVLTAVMASSSWLVFFSPGIAPGEGRMRTSAHRIAEGLQVIRNDRGILAASIATTSSSVLCTFGVYYFAFAALDLPLGVFQSLLMMASQTIGAQLGFTPGALGFKEAFGLYLATLLPLTMAQILVVLAVVRVMTTVASLLLGIPAGLLLSKRLR